MPDQRQNERIAALQFAVELHREGIADLIDLTGSVEAANQAVTGTALTFYAFLRGPLDIEVRLTVVDNATNQPVRTIPGGTMAQITTTQHLEYEVRVIDRGGFGIPDRPADPTDDVRVELEGPDGVVSHTPSEDTRRGRFDVIGLGDTTVRFVFPTAEGDKDRVEAIQVVNSEADLVEVILTPVDNEPEPTPEG